MSFGEMGETAAGKTVWALFESCLPQEFRGGRNHISLVQLAKVEFERGLNAYEVKLLFESVTPGIFSTPILAALQSSIPWS